MSVKLPKKILYLFAQKNNKNEDIPGRIEKITSVLMFESAPQSKCAIAYKIIKADKEVVNITVIYSIIRDDLQSDVTSILLCLDEIT